MADESVVAVGDLIVAEVVGEVEAALLAARPCTFDVHVPGLAALGLQGHAQPIFSCRTCAASAGRAIGVCEPCMLRCHADHEVVEVGTRRQFRCDCPTAVCPEVCQARPQPAAVGSAGAEEAPAAHRPPANSGNTYGHNFEGRWCSCDGNYDATRDEVRTANAPLLPSTTTTAVGSAAVLVIQLHVPLLSDSTRA
jgi:hypothetical protein